jgi:hypothetical protein
MRGRPSSGGLKPSTFDTRSVRFPTGMGSQDKRRTGQGSRTKPLVLLEPVFVEMTAEEEQRALEALAELLAPLSSNLSAKSSPASSHYQVSIRPDGTPGVVAIDRARGS